MDQDKVEMISEQLNALIGVWNLLRAKSLSHENKERCEELLLEILEIKQAGIEGAL